MNIKNTKTKILDLDLKGCLYLNHFSHQHKIARFFKVISRLGDGLFWYLMLVLVWGIQGIGYSLQIVYLILGCSIGTVIYSQTTLLFIQDSKKTRNNSSTESINHSLRLRLTHAHMCSIGFKSGLYAGSQRILCPCCSNNS